VGNVPEQKPDDASRLEPGADGDSRPVPDPDPAPTAAAPATPGRDTPVPTTTGEARSSELSALLAEMVRVDDGPVEGWSPDLRPGGFVGRFRIVRELGRGGFGVVYEARDEELDRAVAVKVLRPGTRVASQSRAWLEREARAVARLNHRHIVTLHDFGQSPAGPFLVFELLRGTSLARRLDAGRLPLADTLAVGVDVARALVHAHESGVVHRDLKPANVHLDPDGTTKVLDFGLAHLFGQAPGASGGTPAYMAPEQWEANGGEPRSDLFALGVMLHQCLAGVLPYRADQGWSEVLEPGPTPALPRRAGPPALRRLVASCLERDPARRPPDARSVRDALLAIRRAHHGRFRRRALAALGAVTTAAIAIAAWVVARQEPPPGEIVRAVLATTDNVAGERALGALDGLVRAALGSSRRVRLVAPARLDLVAREAGFPAGAPLDAERARALARVAGAAVVLVPAARREGIDVTVEVRGIEAETGRVLFTVREPLARPDDLARAADRLADEVRGALAERHDDRRFRRPVAEAVTSSAEAARLYYEGVDCVAPRLAFQDVLEARCAPLFERALALDPAFALAHYQLAVLRSTHGGAAGDTRADLEAALRGVDRLPPREASLVRALAAREQGRVPDALAAYQAVLTDDPDDADALLGAGLLLFDHGAWADAVPYLEKLAELEPEQEDPAYQLGDALGRLRRDGALRALVARWRAEPLNPARRKAIVNALLWLGDAGEAVKEAERRVPGEAGPELDVLMPALAAAGQYDAVQAAARAFAQRHPDDPWREVPTARALAAQGRVREALRLATRSARGAPSRDPLMAGVHYRLAMLSASAGDPARIWPHAERAAAVSPDQNAGLAVVLALLDDVHDAEQLAQALPAGTPAAELYAAVARWRNGDGAGALAALLAAEERDPMPMWLPPPAYLILEIAVATGDFEEALAAAERLRRLPPRGMIHCWTYPRALYLSASARLALGDRANAARELDALLRLWAGADRDLRLLRDARALRAKL
jgi:eukaryotic-like serine/threonine-protein kinase